MILMASKLLNCDTREFVPWTPRCSAVLVPPYVNAVCAEWYVHLNFVGNPIEYIHYKRAVAWFIGNRIPVSYRRGSITTFVFIIVKILVWRNCLTHSAQDEQYLGAIAIEIPEGANLDDYKTAGIFYVENAARAQTFSNCPTNSAFRMEVAPTNFGWFKTSAQTTRVQQRIWINSATPREFRRTWNGSSWGQWYEVSMTALQ